MLKKILTKGIKAKILIVLIIAVLVGFSIFLMFFTILSPITKAMSAIDNTASSISTNSFDFFDKLTNFFTFNGFNSSSNVFYDKLIKANKTYGTRIDIPLILSTIYYPIDVGFDAQTANCLEASSDTTDSECSSYITADEEDSLVDNNFDEVTEESKAEKEAAKETASNAGISDEDAIAVLTVKEGRLKKLINHMISLGSSEPEYEKYDTYLRESFIKESKEFGYPWGYDTTTEIDKIDAKINRIIKEIHARADLYEELFQSEISLYGDPLIAELMAAGYLESPAKSGYRVTSCYGARTLGTHLGIDLVIDDKKVYAAGTGTVHINYSSTNANCYDSNNPKSTALCTSKGISTGGNIITITHDFGQEAGTTYQTVYMHLSTIAAGLKDGQTVEKGDFIGVQGNTGHSEASHLHFGFIKNGTAINALQLFSSATSYGGNCPAITSGGGSVVDIPSDLDGSKNANVQNDEVARTLLNQVLNDSTLSTQRKNIVKVAMSLYKIVYYEIPDGKYNKKGIDPTWGSTGGYNGGPNGLDCSGFTWWVYYNALDATIADYSIDQCNSGTRISISDSKPGDLGCRTTKSGTPNGHVSIYLGLYNGEPMWIHAAGEGNMIEIRGQYSSSQDKQFVNIRLGLNFGN